jgi:hypothetical protein
VRLAIAAHFRNRLGPAQRGVDRLARGIEAAGQREIALPHAIDLAGAQIVDQATQVFCGRTRKLSGDQAIAVERGGSVITCPAFGPVA